MSDTESPRVAAGQLVPSALRNQALLLNAFLKSIEIISIFCYSFCLRSRHSRDLWPCYYYCYLLFGTPIPSAWCPRSRPLDRLASQRERDWRPPPVHTALRCDGPSVHVHEVRHSVITGEEKQVRISNSRSNTQNPTQALDFSATTVIIMVTETYRVFSRHTSAPAR